MRSSVGIANSHGAKGALVRRIGATRIGCASPRFSVGPIGMGAIDGKFAQARTFRHLDRQCHGISRLEASSAIFIVRIDGHYALHSRGAGRPTLNFRSKRSQHQRRLHLRNIGAEKARKNDEPKHRRQFENLGATAVPRQIIFRGERSLSRQKIKTPFRPVEDGRDAL